MAVRKQKVQKDHIRTCEKMTLQRSNQLAAYGRRSAIMARSKGLSVDDWSAYCGLIGDNNTAAWLTGWNKVWEEVNVKII